MIRSPRKTVHLMLPMELYDCLSQLARDSHRTLPSYIRQILTAYLRHLHEDENMGERWLTQ